MLQNQPFASITEDIYQVRLPLPFALRIVNCYLLRGDSGWTILDTGLNTAAARATWQTTFAALDIEPADIQQIVLTHVHPDHYGLAGWLQALCRDEQTGSVPPVRMSPREAEMVRQFWAVQAGWEEMLNQFWRVCGMPVKLATAVTASTVKTRGLTYPHPGHVETIEPGRRIHLGNRRFEAIHMPGHSDGQLVFYDTDDRLLFCGDHVLIKITPHIGRWPFGDLDPLGNYLASLRELSQLNVALSLPGHGPLITDLYGRLAELQLHHAQRLEHTMTAVPRRTTVYEASQHIFDYDGLSLHEIRFAIAETLAHLEYLMHRKRLQRHDNGVWLYHI